MHTDAPRTPGSRTPAAHGLRTRARLLVAASLAMIGSLVSPVAATPTSTASTASTTSPTAGAQTSSSASRSGQRKLILNPTDSSWVSKRQPDRARGHSPVLKIRKNKQETYLKFDRSALDGRKVVSATLHLKVRSNRAAKGGVVVHPASGAWSANTLTHSNRPRKVKRALNPVPRMALPGAWVHLSLSNATKSLSKGALAFRLTFSRASGSNVFQKVGRGAPRLVLITRVAQPSDIDDAKVFAHYFPPYPISLDNEPPANDYYARNYLTIDGENGKHRAYGGLLRDRPLSRNPRRGDWRLADLRTEVRQAKAAGIDGFTVDILELSGRTWGFVQELMKAANQVGGLKIVPMLDAAAGGTARSPEQAAVAVSKLLAHRSAHTIRGDYLLSAFCAEATPVSWWKALIARLEQHHKLPIKFLPVFVNPSEANMEAFAPFSYGLGDWGYRTGPGALRAPDYAAKAHALGKKWMQPVAFQDARPRSSVYAEAGNTEAARATWARAIKDDADLVQIVTWNDYSESTSIAPSQAHGYVFLAINSYYLRWFSEGKRPEITSDHLFLTHRKHHWQARTTSGINNMQPTLGGSVVPRDTVEALVFLTSPATVTVTSGTNSKTVALPAGISRVLVPLSAGRPSASIRRGSTTVKAVTSPYTVTLTPKVQDFQYYASGS